MQFLGSGRRTCAFSFALSVGTLVPGSSRCRAISRCSARGVCCGAAAVSGTPAPAQRNKSLQQGLAVAGPPADRGAADQSVQLRCGHRHAAGLAAVKRVGLNWSGAAAAGAVPLVTPLQAYILTGQLRGAARACVSRGRHIAGLPATERVELGGGIASRSRAVRQALPQARQPLARRGNLRTVWALRREHARLAGCCERRPWDKAVKSGGATGGY